MFGYIKFAALVIKDFWFGLKPNTRKNVYISTTVLVLGTTANILTLGTENFGPSLFGAITGSIGTAIMFYLCPPKAKAQPNQVQP